MALHCPACRRKLSDSAEPPVFCMYCGQRLRASTTTPPIDPGSGSDHTTTAYTPAATGDSTWGDAAEAVGGFRLVRFLGAGGMGSVYEAEHAETGHRVALKLLSNRLAAHPSSVERFRQEGRVASQISHPHCVFVLGADTDAGRPYILMELMPGRTLKDLVEESGPLPVGAAVARILDVIDGLAEAHRLGVIHRDVKPSNCFLTADDRVKVGDFGLSKSLTPAAADKHLTQSGAFLGTVLFASPEQIRGEPVGYESDVYAVCSTLYYLLTGRAPYQHESITAALAKAVSEPPPPIREKRPDVPRELERVILRGLDRDRDRRWQSLADLRDALQDLQPDQQQPARPRSMVLAYVADVLLLECLIVPVEVLRQVAVGSDEFGPTGMSWPGLLITVAYFTLFEGLLGYTPGKRLLRLRVCRVDQVGPPGLGPALARTLVFNALWVVLFLVPEWLMEWPGGAAGAVLGFASAVLAVAALLVQLRPTPLRREGVASFIGRERGLVRPLAGRAWRQVAYRGLHDFASGCRVVQRPRPAHRARLLSRFPNPLDRPQPPPDPLPAVVGGFQVSGKVCDLPDGGEVWAAEDKALTRRVLLRVLPPGHEDDRSEATVTRPTRLRVVGRGSVEWRGAERSWVGYVAPAGAPLVDVVDPARPLTWADARPLLEQLADELAAAAEDGSGVWRPTVEQVWVEPGGRLQVLDVPLPTGSAGPNRTPAPDTPDPLALVRQVATLALEGRPRADGPRVAAPVPPHAGHILDRLFGVGGDPYPGLGPLRVELGESHVHPPEVTAGIRAAHLSVQGLLLATGLAVMLGLSGLFTFVVAVTAVAQTRVAEQVREAVRTPEGRAKLVARAEAEAANRPGVRDRVEEVLAPDEVDRTVRMLGELIDRRKDEVEGLRARLVRPEQAMLGAWERAVAQEDASADGAPLYAVYGQVQAARGSVRDEAVAYRRGLAVVFMVGVVVWPVGWAVFAFVFRGGLAMRLAGITLVRADGRPAGRWRCAVRELLVWLPFTAAVLLCLWVQVAFPGWVAGRVGLWLAAALMLPAYVLVAMRYPVRPPQDRIMGTYLVPA